MDPLTQGVVAAVAAQQPVKREHFVIATLLGLLAGMAPDLDVFIRSNDDPLLALEYHRQFTHSLFFIPFGSFVCAGVFYIAFAKRRGLSFKQVWFYCGLGYATHALLDACTTYGTQLFWPFSDVRIAWNTISIIDPLFTVPLLALIITAAYRRKRAFAHMALVWIAMYSSFGIVQRERAEAIGWQLAESRGHQPTKLEAKPSFANLFVWKIVYSTDTMYYVDAVKVAFKGKVIEGSSIPKLDIAQAFPWLDKNSQQAKDIERFRWFSNGYIALSPQYSDRIIDIRYSMIPNEIKGLWGIQLDAALDSDQHITYIVNRSRDKNTLMRLWKMIIE